MRLPLLLAIVALSFLSSVTAAAKKAVQSSCSRAETIDTSNGKKSWFVTGTGKNSNFQKEFTCGDVSRSYASVYKFTAARAGRFYIDTTFSENCDDDSNDIVMEIRKTTCDGAVISCDDDSSLLNYCPKSFVDLNAGETAFVLISYFGEYNDAPQFSMRIDFVVASSTTPNTVAPTKFPTSLPTKQRTKEPTQQINTDARTNAPTRLPTRLPTRFPTRFPTRRPGTTALPIMRPTKFPTMRVTNSPTKPLTLAPASPSSPYSIELRYLGSITSKQKEAFELAKAKWQRVITSGIAVKSIIRKGSRVCEQGPAVADYEIQDLIIFVSILYIDGVDGTLAYAGPCVVLGGMVRAGSMTFDSADVDGLIAGGMFTDTVLHEMGHILGIGTMWDDRGLITPASRAGLPLYLGAKGNEGLAQAGGPAGSQIKVENLGGGGTARGHWKDSVYATELMTGFLDQDSPMSIFTIKSLLDLGYDSVNVEEADAYKVPPSNMGRLLRDPKKKTVRMGDDFYRGPVVELDLENDAVVKTGREADWEKIKRDHLRKRKEKGKVPTVATEKSGGV